MVATVGPCASFHSGRLEATKMVETTRKLGAQEFLETIDSVQAKNWIKRIERIFEVIECPKERKVNIAAFLLKGRALNWWTSIISRQPQGAKMTWGYFKRAYYQQYYIDHYRDRKKREFTHLTWGNMFVADYEATFIELSRFAEAFVADEKEKCRLFQDGLNLSIQAKTRMQHYNNCSELV